VLACVLPACCGVMKSAVAAISKIKASLRKLLSSKLEALLVSLWGQARVNLSLQINNTADMAANSLITHQRESNNNINYAHKQIKIPLSRQIKLQTSLEK